DKLGFGKPKRRQGNLDILAGKTTFRIVTHGHSFEECKEELKRIIKLDHGFKEFELWCRGNDRELTFWRAKTACTRAN
ncbi:hypothetical protein C8J57DRAFT_1075909, partial [Mycena rebaudengoi]